MKNKTKNVRKEKQKWSEALRNAYAMGFQDGYSSYEQMPKGKGVIVAATAGYENGAAAHKKKIKNSAKIQKIDEKQKRVSTRLTGGTKKGENHEEKRSIKTKGYQAPQGNGKRQKVCKV